jgi:hypothetical protein
MPRYRQGWSRGWKKSTRGAAGEWFDSWWEVQYMDELEHDPLVARWTRHHGLRIPYRKWWGGSGHYEPDFLVEVVGGGKELREVKGEHLFADANTSRKLRAGDEFCRARGMTFRLVTKTPVGPDVWAPSQAVAVEERSSDARPAFQEDAHRAQPAGCLGVLAAVALALPSAILSAFRPR